MAVERESFGTTRTGIPVEKITIRGGGLEAEIITYGGALRALRAPSKDGGSTDVVLGFDSLTDYEENACYLGAIVGRYANRIANASCLIDGRAAALVPNEGPNQLHGGPEGFSGQVFRVEGTEENRVTLRYTSPDGECGFPGKLELRATYTLADRALRIRFEAESDKATYCNLTSHAYFNLNGGGDAMDHTLWLAAEHYTPVGAGGIPIAKARPAAGTPFDFTTAKRLSRDIGQADEQLQRAGGYDHNFLLTPGEGLRLAARLTGDRSGIVMETWTEKPGLQLYSGNALAAQNGKAGAGYGPRMGICLETQFIPDSPNHPEWGDIVLRPGMRYDYTTEYRFPEG